MLNITLVRDQSRNPITKRIEWAPTSRRWRNCEEDYRVVHYHEDGNRDREFIAFVGENTTLPDTFRTSGYDEKLLFFAATRYEYAALRMIISLL